MIVSDNTVCGINWAGKYKYEMMKFSCFCDCGIIYYTQKKNKRLRSRHLFFLRVVTSKRPMKSDRKRVSASLRVRKQNASLPASVTRGGLMMQENRPKYFEAALSDFVFDVAAGGAIRHLVDRGYSVEQMMK